jgi:hypothetical protein
MWLLEDHARGRCTECATGDDVSVPSERLLDLDDVRHRKRQRHDDDRTAFVERAWFILRTSP